jgi:hypothetical protein
MAEFQCNECGAANPPDARFCGGCDAYLGWDKAPPAASAAAAAEAQGGAAPAAATATATEDSRAIPPHVKLLVSEAVIKPDEGASIEMQVRNNSTIVDAYRIDAKERPEWLTIEQPEIRLMPGENQAMTATFKLVEGAFVEAQTVKLPLRISSLRDTTKFADANVMLTVPRYGPPVTIRARPEVVRLVDETDGQIEVLLDNSASNYRRRLQLAASDTEAVVKFRFSSPSVEVAAGGNATVEVGIRVPELPGGEARTRQVTITATEDENKVETTVAVNQERSEAVPLRLRLEPSVLRVEDCPVADLTLLIDNREGRQEQTLRLEGRDPEGAVRFSFATPQIVVAAGQIARTRLSVSAPAPRPGEEMSRPFSVIAADGVSESEASGTFVQITTEPPIRLSSLQIAPETLRRRNKSTGRYRFAINNGDDSQWLTAHMFGSDPERTVRFSFAPDRVELPPGGSTWGWVGVSAPRPERGTAATRQLQFGATDGNESVTATGVFIHSSGDWIPIVRAVLTLVGAILVLLGAFTPWMTMQPDYYATDLPRLFSTNLAQRALPGGIPQPIPTPDVVEPTLPVETVEPTQPTTTAEPSQTATTIAQTQVAARTTMIILAVMMAAGLLGRGGKLTMSSAMLVLAGVVGYFVFVSMSDTEVGTGVPMYGAILVGVGAVIGFAGGLLARYQRA